MLSLSDLFSEYSLTTLIIAFVVAQCQELADIYTFREDLLADSLPFAAYRCMNAARSRDPKHLRESKAGLPSKDEIHFRLFTLIFEKSSRSIFSYCLHRG